MRSKFQQKCYFRNIALLLRFFVLNIRIYRRIKNFNYVDKLIGIRLSVLTEPLLFSFYFSSVLFNANGYAFGMHFVQNGYGRGLQRCNYKLSQGSYWFKGPDKFLSRNHRWNVKGFRLVLFSATFKCLHNLNLKYYMNPNPSGFPGSRVGIRLNNRRKKSKLSHSRCT